MRLRNVKNAKEKVDASNYVIKNPENYKGKFNELFLNKGEIHLEIGMGKGDFLIGMAQENPDINFIGIEKYESVMVRALEKLESLDYLPNLKFIRMDATYINEVFGKEISTLYLNFSDPWPKARHAKRRLTSPEFLQKYENILKEKKIIMKTDNIDLFAYSLETLSNFGYKFLKVSLDLHKEDIKNIETEYETKFSKQGIKINYLSAKK